MIMIKFYTNLSFLIFKLTGKTSNYGSFHVKKPGNRPLNLLKIPDFKVI